MEVEEREPASGASRPAGAAGDTSRVASPRSPSPPQYAESVHSESDTPSADGPANKRRKLARAMKLRWAEARAKRDALILEHTQKLIAAARAEQLAAPGSGASRPAAEPAAGSGASRPAAGAAEGTQHLPEGTMLPEMLISTTGQSVFQSTDCSYPVDSPEASQSVSDLIKAIAGDNISVADVALIRGYSGPRYCSDRHTRTLYNHDEWLCRQLAKVRAEHGECHLRVANLAAGPGDWFGYHSVSCPKAEIDRLSRWLSRVLRHAGAASGNRKGFLAQMRRRRLVQRRRCYDEDPGSELG